MLFKKPEIKLTTATRSKMEVVPNKTCLRGSDAG